MEISEVNVPRLYAEAIQVMRAAGVKENSRNGPVITLPYPVMLTIYEPTQRVLFDPVRDANPFFHVMEFVWMMAGSNDVVWLSQFNKRMLEYSDDGLTQHAAYGHRWRTHFGMDQILSVVRMLKANPEDRRIVMGMWDPTADLGYPGKDVPCNTQINFRVVHGALNMTVMNRSNDLIWGSMGANAVHMTMLHELIALAAGLKTGVYRVFTTNLHIYENMPRFKELWNTFAPDDRYYTDKLVPTPLLAIGETLEAFLIDAENIVSGKMVVPTTRWFQDVVVPVYMMWATRDPKLHIYAEDWEIACREWIGRKNR